MTDTPEHIKNLQLQIWLSKSPAERLRQFLINNSEMYAFWKSVKQQMAEKYPTEKNSK
jgi:hypothetical protein